MSQALLLKRLLLLRISITATARCGAGTPAGALTSVSSGAEIGLLSLRLSVSQSESLGDFLRALACTIEKVSLWDPGLSGSETEKGVAKQTRVSRNRRGDWGTRDSGSKAQYAIH